MATLLYSAQSARTPQQRIYEQEFLPLADALYGFAYRLEMDASLAEDLVQETYLKAWRYIERYAEGTNAKAWLFRICRNLFLTAYRNRKKQPYKVDFQDVVVFHNEDDPVKPTYYGLHEELENQQLGDEITFALNALSPNYRAVVLLDMEDFSYEEMAVLLEIPIGTVRSRLHRARNLLAERLREYAAGQGYNVQDQTEHTDAGEQPESSN
jgi:RNA polymerase sigma-70 factor (ECF subfamily)